MKLKSSHRQRIHGSARPLAALLCAAGAVASPALVASGTVAVGGIQDAQTVTRGTKIHMYLTNSLIEVGSRANGSFGIESCDQPNHVPGALSPPAGYHERTDDYANCRATDGKQYGLGFRAVNPVDLDWSQATFGDFFIPGYPYEGFGVGYGSTNYWNTSDYTDITGGAWSSAAAAYTPGTGATGTWAGGMAGVVEVTQVVTIPESGFMLHVDVTLKNTSGSAVGPVYYYRGLDPDNCNTNLTADCGYYYETINTIEYSGDATRGSRVSAWQTDGSYLALLTSEPNSRAIIGGGNSLYCNGFTYTVRTSVGGVYDGTAPCVLPDSALSDLYGYRGIYGDLDYGIAINAGTLEAGASKTIRVTYFMLSPPPPGTIAATGGNAQVTATWTVPAGKYKPVTGYQVEYSTSETGPWTAGSGTCDVATTGVSTGLTCTQTGLTNGTTYYFRVAGINEGGRGLYTTPASAVPTAPPTVSCEGFFAPVDRRPTTNQANAGRVIPLKWRCTNEGVPVTTVPEDFRVTSTSCAVAPGSATTLDAIEEYAPGGSGLINKGDGNWQFNWATPKAYANSCKAVTVTFDGAQIGADFTFKR